MSILASLAKTYERLLDAPALGYSTEKIGFVICLNADGTVAAVAPRGEAVGRKKAVPSLLVPQPAKKSVNISPNFLWGNTAYVLGITAREDKKQKRLTDEHAAFIRYHLDLLRHMDDTGLVALVRFLESWTPDKFVEPLWPKDMQDHNLVFALESERRRDVYLHDRAVAKAVWAEQNVSENAPKTICLVTGEPASAARLHPSIKGVWGAQTSGASIVAFNQESFESFGHKQGDNAPVSIAAAFAYTTALNRFLEKGSQNRIQIGDASTVFWADASDEKVVMEAEGVFAAFLADIDEESEASRVGVILERIRQGAALREVSPELSKGVRFYVLGLAPNAARLSIRFWLEDDFGRLADNYQRFVSDMRIDPPPRGDHPALWKYLAETALLGKRENVSPNLAGEWMRAILTGTRYPLTLLSNVLMRIRADGEVNGLRVGILKALLVRNFRKNEREAPVSLNPENRNKGYLLGRLFAVYEHAQSAALGRNINATIKDKFYGAASATPRNVFALLERNSANHLSKVGKERPGQRINLEKTIAGIMETMSPDGDPFPSSLSAADQALFGLGYYHQRSEFFRKPTIAGTEDAQS